MLCLGLKHSWAQRWALRWTEQVSMWCGDLSPDPVLWETGPSPECYTGSPEVVAGLNQKMYILLSSACLATSSHLSIYPNSDVMEPKVPAAGSPRGQPAPGNRVCEQHLRGQGSEEVTPQPGAQLSSRKASGVRRSRGWGVAAPRNKEQGEQLLLPRAPGKPDKG